MFTSFQELMEKKKSKVDTCPYCGHEGEIKELDDCCDEAQADGFNSSTIKLLGRELAADIVAELKSAEHSPEYRKEMNKQRIEALNLKLIQGGKV